MKNTDLVSPHIDLSVEQPDLENPSYDPEVFPDARLPLPQEQAEDRELTKIISQSRATTGFLSTLTGAYGLLGQLIDIPGFYATALMNIGRIAQHHGFDPTGPQERRFALQVLMIGHLPTEESRHKELAKIYAPKSKQLYAKELAALVASKGSTLSLYKLAARTLSSRFRFLVPVVGAATNLAANMRFMEAILDTAVTAYERRRELKRCMNSGG